MDEYKYPAETIEWAKAQMATADAQTGSPNQQTSCSLEDYAKSLGGKATGGLAGDSGLAQLGQAWGGTYPPPVEPHPCPACGYCPHCGRGGTVVPHYPPSIPYYGPYYPPVYPPYTITC